MDTKILPGYVVEIRGLSHEMVFSGRTNADGCLECLWFDLHDNLQRHFFREEILKPRAISNADVREYISGTLRNYRDNTEFMQALPAYLDSDPASQERLPGLREKINNIARMGRNES